MLSPDTMVREGESEDEERGRGTKTIERERERAREQLNNQGKKQRRERIESSASPENREPEQGARRCTLTGFFALGLQQAQAQVQLFALTALGGCICQVRLLRYRLL